MDSRRYARLYSIHGLLVLSPTSFKSVRDSRALTLTKNGIKKKNLKIVINILKIRKKNCVKLKISHDFQIRFKTYGMKKIKNNQNIKINFINFFKPQY